jgi:hypothetical protein
MLELLELLELKTGLRVRGLAAPDVSIVAVVIEVGPITNGVVQALLSVNVDRTSRVRSARVHRSIRHTSVELSSDRRLPRWDVPL